MMQNEQADNLSSQQTIDALAAHYEAILRLIGEDPSRQGLLKTPERAAKALYHITKGYRSSVEETVGDALFDTTSSGMIIVRDIEFYSLCEHHILPFFGHVSVGYIPDGKILGLSKVARIVDLFARRLQVQERLTAEIAQAVMDAAGAKGVIVSCSGQHLCMQMRGVEKQNSATVTTESIGVFADDRALREEFFSAIK